MRGLVRGIRFQRPVEGFQCERLAAERLPFQSGKDGVLRRLHELFCEPKPADAFADRVFPVDLDVQIVQGDPFPDKV